MNRTLALLAVAGLAACGGQRERAAVEPGVATVETASLSIQHGEIGAGPTRKPATYVLVNARNTSGADRHLALEGDLLDGAGAKLGRLSVDSLRVPAGGMRTFALVHHGGEVTGATGADVRITGATVESHPSSIEITDGNVYQDGDRVVVAGTVHNRASRRVYATIIAGFHDAKGVAVQRPFTVFELDPGGSRSARFVGPPGSVEAYLFVGEEVF